MMASGANSRPEVAGEDKRADEGYSGLFFKG